MTRRPQAERRGWLMPIVRAAMSMIAPARGARADCRTRHALGAAALVLGLVAVARGRDVSIASPDGTVRVTIDDADGLRYRVTLDGRPVLARSALGLDFEGGASLGPRARIESWVTSEHDATVENPFGQHRRIRDHYRELAVVATEQAHAPAQPAHLKLLVRAYDNGVAFRYELPRQPGLDAFVVTNERTEFAFPSDLNCWAGTYSDCAESQYPKRHVSELTRNEAKPQVLPLVVALPNGYAAVTESDLLDWAGMFVTAAPPRGDGAPRFAAKVTLARRKDHRGLVVGGERRVSPWRVIMLARKAGDLVANDLVWTLATPSRIADPSWIKPGVTAWDAWWTGVNPSQPGFRGLNARGDTRSDKAYIDFAAEMGFRYQLIDWFWYEPMNSPKADLTTPAAQVDIPGLVAYARERGVRLLLWLDSRDLARQGFARVFDQVAAWGFAGVKIDFMNSDSQETVRWYAAALEAAAARHLLVDFHGAYKPTGLARTWPNFITQEGVLGNEYNKIRAGACTTRHTITLPFTRGLLGPMDFTPGGFLNRTAAGFKVTAPTEVIGTRTRQLAETVVYFSPLLCLCDAPANYRGQPGVEFFRGLPTVWDDTVVLSAGFAEHIVLARRSGNRWYIAGMNGDAPLSVHVPLSFLGAGKWSLRAFADTADSATQPERLSDSTRTVSAGDELTLSFAPSGGYAAVLSPQ